MAYSEEKRKEVGELFEALLLGNLDYEDAKEISEDSALRAYQAVRYEIQLEKLYELLQAEARFPTPAEDLQMDKLEAKKARLLEGE